VAVGIPRSPEQAAALAAIESRIAETISSRRLQHPKEQSSKACFLNLNKTDKKLVKFQF
jgi:hypothetical protein